MLVLIERRLAEVCERVSEKGVGKNFLRFASTMPSLLRNFQLHANVFLSLPSPPSQNVQPPAYFSSLPTSLLILMLLSSTDASAIDNLTMTLFPSHPIERTHPNSTEYQSYPHQSTWN